MAPAAVCVRCGGPLAADRCGHHGEVAALRVIAPPEPGTAGDIAQDSRVPLWLLAPAPVDWTFGGVAYAADDRATRATAVAWSGPAPLGGGADLLVVAEEPGTGLGARYAGLAGLDPGDIAVGRPTEHVEIAGHPVALWSCEAVERTVLVGEAEGTWLWLVIWPASAGTLLAERLVLVDARERLVPQQRGPASARLSA